MSAAPPVYGQDEMNDQIKSWFEAAEAYRAEDMERAVNLLVPLHEHDADTYAMLVANVSLGAVLIGLQLADSAGQPAGEPPPGGEWVAEAVDPRRERTAAERLCAMAVTTAANGDYDRTIQMVQTFAHPSERGVSRLTDAMTLLLSMFAAVSKPEVDR